MIVARYVQKHESEKYELALTLVPVLVFLIGPLTSLNISPSYSHLQRATTSCNLRPLAMLG